MAWVAVAALGLAHVRLSAWLLKVLLGLELLVVVGFAAVGLTHPAGGHVPLAPLWPAHLLGQGVGGVIVLIVASQLGLETILAFSEEARSHKLLFRASLAGVAVLGGLLTASAWALAALTGIDHVNEITADTVFGALGGHLGYLALVLAEVLLVSSILAAMISVLIGLRSTDSPHMPGSWPKPRGRCRHGERQTGHPLSGGDAGRTCSGATATRNARATSTGSR